jgi:hypothetical protein
MSMFTSVSYSVYTYITFLRILYTYVSLSMPRATVTMTGEVYRSAARREALRLDMAL